MRVVLLQACPRIDLAVSKSSGWCSRRLALNYERRAGAQAEFSIDVLKYMELDQNHDEKEETH